MPCGYTCLSGQVFDRCLEGEDSFRTLLVYIYPIYLRATQFIISQEYVATRWQTVNSLAKIRILVLAH